MSPTATPPCRASLSYPPSTLRTLPSFPFPMWHSPQTPAEVLDCFFSLLMLFLILLTLLLVPVFMRGL